MYKTGDIPRLRDLLLSKGKIDPISNNFHEYNLSLENSLTTMEKGSSSFEQAKLSNISAGNDIKINIIAEHTDNTINEQGGSVLLNGVSLNALDGDLNITAKTIQDTALIEENLTQRKRNTYTYEGTIRMESLPSLSVAHYASPNDLYLSLEEEEDKDFSYKDIEEKVTSSNAVSSKFIVGKDINLHSYEDISLEGTQIVSTPNQNLNNVLLHSEMGSILLKAAESTASSNFKETYAASSNLRFDVPEGASKDSENNKVLLFSSAYIDAFDEGSVFKDRISWIDEETKGIDLELQQETLADSKKALLLERKTNLAKEKDNYLLKKDKDVATHIKDPEEYYSYENLQNTISYNPINIIASNDINITSTRRYFISESSNLKTQSGDLNLKTNLGDIKIESLENSQQKIS